MADPNVDWETCADDGCIGIRLPTGGRCWAHADRSDLEPAITRISSEDGHVDARGVPINQELLERLVAAAPRDNSGNPILTGARFDKATFQRDARFTEAVFQSDTTFREAVFEGGAMFRGVTFQDIVWFNEAVFQDSAWFSGVVFQEDARFDKAAFQRDARFRRATFQREGWFQETIFKGEGWFEGTTFERTAWFVDATFQGDARFAAADFQGIVRFDRATFQRDARFRGAWFSRETAMFREVTFQRDARFDRATFQGVAQFEKASFQDSTWFDGATFRRDARYDGATFQRSRQLGPMLVRKGLVLDGAIFHERLQIQVSAAAVCCQRTRFLAGVQLRMRWAQVVLDDADLAAPSILTGVPPFPNLDEGRWAKAIERLLPQRRGRRGRWRWQPRLLSLRRADVAGLTVGLVDMRACQFADAHNLDTLRLETLGAFGDTPSGWRWTARQALAEEHHWRSLRAASRQPPKPSGTSAPPHQQGQHRRTWFPPACRPPSWVPMGSLAPVQIAALYRALRKGREDNKDEPGAADFYYGEMEMRRFAKREDAKAERRRRRFGSWASAATEYAVLWLYWLVSGYGLRAWRALAALVVVIGLVGVGFSRVGFHHPHPSQVVSWLYALQATVSLEGKAPQLSGQLTLPGELLRVSLRFSGPVLLGLALLSLRGRVKR